MRRQIEPCRGHINLGSALQLFAMAFSTSSILTLLFAFASASPLLEQRQALATVYSTCSRPNAVALTFDDGPHQYLRTIGDSVTAAGGHATFYFNGLNAGRCIYDEVHSSAIQYVTGQGHQVASHTWSHLDLATLPQEQVVDEIQRMDDALLKIVGVTPASIRAPFGSMDDTTRSIIGARGQSLAQWNVDLQDTLGAAPSQSMALLDDFIAAKLSGGIVLLHETKDTSVLEVLPYAIRQLKAAGYDLVTMAECTGQSAYLVQQAPSPRDDSWHC